MRGFLYEVADFPLTPALSLRERGIREESFYSFSFGEKLGMRDFLYEVADYPSPRPSPSGRRGQDMKAFALSPPGEGNKRINPAFSRNPKPSAKTGGDDTHRE